MSDIRIKKLFTFSVIFLMFTGAMCTATHGTMLTNYIQHYELESSAQGLMSFMQSAGNLMALLLIGLVVGRIQKTTIVLLYAIITPLVFLMLSTRPAFPVFLTGYLIYGVAFGFQDSLASSLMVDLNQERSDLYMNALHGVYGLGGIIAPVFYSLMMNNGLPWNRVLAVVACICSVSCIVYMICRMKLNKHFVGNAVPTRRITIADIKHFVTENRKVLMLCCAFLFGAHQIGISSWATRYVNEFLGAKQYGALALSMFWVGTAASRLLCSFLPISRAKKICLGFFLTTAFIAIGIISKSGFIMMICCLLAGFAEGPILPLMLDMSCTWERENTSLGSTMVLLSLYIGFLAMPLLIGKMSAVFNMTVGFWMPVIASLIGAVLSIKFIKYDK